MKGCIVYFSGTGNTEFVAKAIKNEFAQKTFEEKSLEIDAKIEALTKFENQFTQIIENVLDKHK